jgi:hypothetical protein
MPVTSERSAEVEHVELGLQWGPCQRKAADQGAQQGALATARPTDDRDMSPGAGKVDGQGVASLVAGTVHGAEGHRQPAAGAPLPRDQTEVGVGRQVWHQPVEGVGEVERRQPDPVGLGAEPDHPAHRDLEQRLGLRGRRVKRRLPGGCLLPGRGRRRDLGDRPRQDLRRGAHLVAGPAPDGVWNRRGGDVGRLEPGQGRLSGCEDAESRCRRELMSVGYAERAPRLLGRERAQTDPVGQMGLQAPEPALLQPLRGEQEVEPERPPQPAYRDEQVDELGPGRQQLRELVHDDEQRRQGSEVGAGRPGVLIVTHRCVVPCLTQQLLAPHHLAGQGVLHAIDERQLLLEVGDQRRDMGHPGHAGERRTALEVDQHHVQLRGAVRHREREDQRAQELRLA